MTPERVVRLIALWVRLYTRRLPAAVARRRVLEIDADVHDHIAHERALGTPERRIALSILSRTVRGLAADVSWRRHARRSRGARMTSLVALVALVAIVIGVAAVVLGEADDSPGLQLLGALFVAGAVWLSVRTVKRTR